MELDDILEEIDNPVVNSRLRNVIDKMKSANRILKLEAFQEAHQYLSADRNAPIDFFVSHGIIPILMSCLTSTDSELLLEASKLLTDVSSGESKSTEAIVSEGAVPVLIQLLSSSIREVIEQSLYTIGNIVADSPRLRDLCLQQGILDPLLNFLHSDLPLTLLRVVSYNIESITLDSYMRLSEETIKRILPELKVLIRHTDEEILVRTLSSLEKIAEMGGGEEIQQIIDSNMVPPIVELLAHKRPAVQNGALNAIGKIANGTKREIQHLLDCGLFQSVLPLLENAKPLVKADIFHLLDTVMSVNGNAVQHALESGLVTLLIKLMKEKHYKVQMEATKVARILIIESSPEQIIELVENGILAPLCALLNSKNHKIVEDALRGIIHILNSSNDIDYSVALAQIREIGASETIRKLSNNSTKAITNLSKEFIAISISNSESEPSEASTSEQVQ